MRIYIIDDNTEAELSIYGVDGNEHTEQFFITHFTGKGIKFLTNEEKAKYNTAADCAISNICYEVLGTVIADLQKAIDDIAEEYERNNSDIKGVYTFDNKCYAI